MNQYKALVCGDREWTDEFKMRRRLEALARESHTHPIARWEIIHGDCRGADRLADRVARLLGLTVRPFPADWEKYGKAAGPIRNREMLDTNPDLVIAFHPRLARSRGTYDTVMEANRRGIPVEIIP